MVKDDSELQEMLERLNAVMETMDMNVNVKKGNGDRYVEIKWTHPEASSYLSW